MSTFDETWLHPNHSSKPSLSAFFDDYQKIREASHLRTTSVSKLPQPGDNFEPFLEGYNEVDDILTQTLNSLQELDIPVGDTNTHRPQNSFNKGHMKKPSGTAIFGFAHHDKTLSIPGAIAPSQIYKEKPHSQSEPMLFETVQDLEKKVNKKEDNDFIITNNEPNRYKFPSPTSISSAASPDHATASHNQKTVQVPVEYLQKLKSMIKSADGLDMEAFLAGNFDNLIQTPKEEKLVEVSSKKTPNQEETNSLRQSQALRNDTTKEVPNSPRKNYLPRKSAVGLGLQYEDSYSSHNNYPNEQILSPPNSVQQVHPPMYQVPYYGHSNYMAPVYTQQPYPNTLPHQLPLQQPYHVQPQEMPVPQAQVHFQLPQQQTLKLHHHQQQPTVLPPPPPSQNSHIPHQIDSSESEFSDTPKTPSPTLKSQATFDTPLKTSPRKTISWTPVTNACRITMSEGRKPHDKVSTLPPGEIDLYIIGPREDKTYVCNYENCGKLFTRRYNARSHVQTHLSDRPFVCDFDNCNKSFVRQHDLTRHKKVHTEFAHKCKCGKSFARHDALFRHRQRQICCGAFSNEELATQTLSTGNPPSGSVTKPKKQPNQTIRIENDTVAKRLDFDIVKKSQSPIKVSKSMASNSSLDLNHDKPDFDDRDESNVFYDLNFNEAYLNEF